MAVRDVVQAAAGVGGGGEYVEDVFSTYLFTGTGTTTAITNGIDLDGEGGLVWIKDRDSGAKGHALFDTERGGQYKLQTSWTGAQTSFNNIVFNSDGFTNDTLGDNNGSGTTYASWTFRKAPKFFDVVTYTGDGTSGQTVSHALNATPGMIIVKRTDSTSNWAVAAFNGSNYDLLPGLNLTNGRLFTGSTSNYTSTEFKPYNLFQQFTDVPSADRMNVSGATYVAYLFAHDAGGFGDDGEQNVISCGSYTGNSSSLPNTISLGFEPQWVMVKKSNGSSDWAIWDVMRGMSLSNNAEALEPNTSDAESATGNIIVYPTADGFEFNDASDFANINGGTYIYIAIRRPMKTPESGTEVFMPDLAGSAGDGQQPWFRSGFPVDLGMYADRGGSSNNIRFNDRLRGAKELVSSSTIAEFAGPGGFDFMNGWYPASSNTPSFVSWMFKRAPSFMDVVAYTGTGVARTVNHNLGVVPELIIVKCRSNGSDWGIYSKSLASAQYLVFRNPAADTNDALFGFGYPSATTFNVDRIDTTNYSGRTYVAYLFATLAGVSKVGSYTGTGANLNVDCGFSAGARFILIKRTDSTGDWYVWDSARGIVSGNDPYLLLNSTAAEVTSTDYIDPLASGFTVTSSAPAALNASGGSYIFLAIA